MSRYGRGAPARVDPVVLPVVCCAIGALVSIGAVVASPGRFAYRSVPAHVALETADAVIAALVAYLAYGRARRARGARDVVLAAALALLAVANVTFAATASVAQSGVPAPFQAWALIATRLVASALLAVAGCMASGMSARRARLPLAGAAGALAATLVALAVARSGLPQPIAPTAIPADVPPGGAAAVLRALEFSQAALLGIGGVAFALRAARSRDRVEMWIGAAAILGGFARVDYAVVPSMLTEWVSTGDALRTAFYLLLLTSAAAEITRYWAAQSDAAVLAERQRVARDLHDGAVQEIGYVRSVAGRMARRSDDPDTGRILTAAERALDEMRSALTALTAPLDEPLVETIRRAACEVGDRYDVGVLTTADGDVTVTHAEREALCRIAREAVINAARHGRASKVVIELRDRPRSLAVRDDGEGFDEDAVRPGGFGIVSMRDRAAGIGGTLDLESARGCGTTVRVTW
jgi:signal transduction histidine kinase